MTISTCEVKSTPLDSRVFFGILVSFSRIIRKASLSKPQLILGKPSRIVSLVGGKESSVCKDVVAIYEY
jgi:hypothetical protein